MRTFLPLLFLATSVHAAITGTLIDERGKPVAGATIEVFPAEDSRTLRARLLSKTSDRTPVSTAQSSDSGTFSINPKGAVADVAIRMGGRLVVGLELPDGQDAGTIVVPARALRRVRVLAGGKPVSNAIVAAGPFIVRTDASGIAELPESSSVTGHVAILHPDFAIKEPSVAEGVKPTDVTLAKTAPLSGRVVGADGAAVAQAAISVAGWPLAESDASGNFTIQNPPQNWQALIATAGNRVGMATKQGSRAYEIRLQPANTLNGSVRDSSNGRGVGGVRVDVASHLDRNAAESVITDDKGKFTFGPLPASRYNIAGSHPDFLIVPADVTVTDAKTPAKAIEARPLDRIRGRVIDDQRHPVAGAFVRAPFRGLRSGSVITDPSGQFTLRMNLPPLGTSLRAVKAGYAVGVSGLLTASSKSDAVITLPTGFPLQVKVVDKQGAPVVGASVLMTGGNSESFQDAMMRFSAVCEQPLASDCGTTAADGSATFRIAEGVYDVQVGGERVARRLLPKQALTARSSPLTIEVDHGVDVAGHVVYGDGTPAAGMMVAIRSGGVGGTAARSGDDGSFLLQGLSSGPMTLTASSSEQSPVSVQINAPTQNAVITLPKPSRLLGRVIDKTGGQPITDFVVSIAGSLASFGSLEPFVRPQQFHSDDGTFELDRVPAGKIALRVASSGYGPAMLNDVAVEEGKTVSGVEVQMERGGKVTGRVTSGGQPLAGVAVRTEFGRSPIANNPNFTVTDANGDYVVDGIGAGERPIEFIREGYVIKRKSVEVSAGKESRLDVELERGRELQGRVVETSGRAVPAARVSASGPGFAQTFSDAEGSFTLQGLADGKYTINASKQGYVNARSDAVVPSSSAITLTLDTGGTISGRVLGLPESELSSVTVTAFGAGTASRTQVDPGGSFTLRGVPDGRVMVSASRMGVGTRQSMPKTVEVVNGSAPSVDIDFSEGATISGHVMRLGTMVRGGMVSFAPKSGMSGSAQIGSDGAYEISGLSPGDYVVNVFASSQEINYQTKYTVTGTGTFDIDIRGATLHGRVTDAETGAPLTEARVWIQPSAAVRTAKITVSDSDGRFVIEALPDATVELHVTHDKYAPATRSVVIAGGTVSDVDVQLDSAQEMRIRVVDAVSGASVAAGVTISEGRTTIANGGQSDEGVIHLWLRPGQYKATVGARGYVAQTVDLAVPGPEMRVALIQGGSLAIVSRGGGQARLTLVGLLKPARMARLVPGMLITIDGLAPGRYALEMLDVDGIRVKTSYVADVVAGQIARLTID